MENKASQERMHHVRATQQQHQQQSIDSLSENNFDPIWLENFHLHKEPCLDDSNDYHHASSSNSTSFCNKSWTSSGIEELSELEIGVCSTYSQSAQPTAAPPPLPSGAQQQQFSGNFHFTSKRLLPMTEGQCSSQGSTISQVSYNPLGSGFTPLTPSTGPSSVGDQQLLYIAPKQSASYVQSAEHTSSTGLLLNEHVSRKLSMPLSGGGGSRRQEHCDSSISKSSYNSYRVNSIELRFLSVMKVNVTDPCSMPGNVKSGTHTAWLVESCQMDKSDEFPVDCLFIEKNKMCEIFIMIHPEESNAWDVSGCQYVLRITPFAASENDSQTRLPVLGSINELKQPLNGGNGGMMSSSYIEKYCYVNCKQDNCYYRQLPEGFIVCEVPISRNQQTICLSFPHLNSKCENGWKKQVYLDFALFSVDRDIQVCPAVRIRAFCCSSAARDAQRMFGKCTNNKYFSSPRTKREFPGQVYSSNAKSPVEYCSPEKISRGPTTTTSCEEDVAHSTTSSGLARASSVVMGTSEAPQYAILTKNIEVWKILNNLKTQLEQLLG